MPSIAASFDDCIKKGQERRIRQAAILKAWNSMLLVKYLTKYYLHYYLLTK